MGLARRRGAARKAVRAMVLDMAASIEGCGRVWRIGVVGEAVVPLGAAGGSMQQRQMRAVRQALCHPRPSPRSARGPGLQGWSSCGIGEKG